MVTKKKIKPDAERQLQWLAKAITVSCVRNTVIEDYHARGSLSQEDMRKFNKQVVNKLYTFLRYYLYGTEEELKAILAAIGLSYPMDWDKAIIDSSLNEAVHILTTKR